jgi:phospholipase C
MDGRLSRRQLLSAGAAATGALAASRALPGPVLRVLASAPSQCGSLKDIEHVIIFIQENRSFDHYFGTYPGVRGFSDPAALVQSDGTSIFAQKGYTPGKNPNGRLLPFHLDTNNLSTNAECTNDITHEWGPQHHAWNNGLMDGWVTAHLADDPANGPLTMGYFTRRDIDFYHGLADAFTLCDGYYCSVIGPTDPNRLFSMTGTFDPEGKGGGPIMRTHVQDRPTLFGTCTWTTMPERLQAAGVSWKVYGSADGHFGDNVLAYFKNYTSDPALASNAFTPSFPGTFEADVNAGTLPQVSWVLASLLQSEHPPAPPIHGEWAVSHVLNTLGMNPSVWAKTALFVTYDENGGFFDHVPPPVAPPGTAGEYVTVSQLPPEAQGIRGPIGLGFRVPMFVVSPFARGGFVSSDTFDHTSTLRFLETRFGVEVPNLSAWRRSVTGDLTTAFNFATTDTSIPSLPAPSLTDQRVLQECVPAAILSELTNGKPSPLVPVYSVPPNSMPAQEKGTARRPSGPVTCPSPPPTLGEGKMLAAGAGALAVAAAWWQRRRLAASRADDEARPTDEADTEPV